MENIKCEYCEAVKEDSTFVIGASPEPDWVMHVGTGKMACPNCHSKAEQDGQDAINKNIRRLG